MSDSEFEDLSYGPNLKLQKQLQDKSDEVKQLKVEMQTMKEQVSALQESKDRMFKAMNEKDQAIKTLTVDVLSLSKELLNAGDEKMELKASLIEVETQLRDKLKDSVQESDSFIKMSESITSQNEALKVEVEKLKEEHERQRKVESALKEETQVLLESHAQKMAEVQQLRKRNQDEKKAFEKNWKERSAIMEDQMKLLEERLICTESELKKTLYETKRLKADKLQGDTERQSLQREIDNLCQKITLLENLAKEKEAVCLKSDRQKQELMSSLEKQKMFMQSLAEEKKKITENHEGYQLQIAMLQKQLEVQRQALKQERNRHESAQCQLAVIRKKLIFYEQSSRDISEIHEKQTEVLKNVIERDENRILELEEFSKAKDLQAKNLSKYISDLEKELKRAKKVQIDFSKQLQLAQNDFNDLKLTLEEQKKLNSESQATIITLKNDQIVDRDANLNLLNERDHLLGVIEKLKKQCQQLEVHLVEREADCVQRDKAHKNMSEYSEELENKLKSLTEKYEGKLNNLTKDFEEQAVESAVKISELKQVIVKLEEEKLLLKSSHQNNKSVETEKAIQKQEQVAPFECEEPTIKGLKIDLLEGENELEGESEKIWDECVPLLDHKNEIESLKAEIKRHEEGHTELEEVIECLSQELTQERKESKELKQRIQAMKIESEERQKDFNALEKEYDDEIINLKKSLQKKSSSEPSENMSDVLEYEACKWYNGIKKNISCMDLEAGTKKHLLEEEVGQVLGKIEDIFEVKGLKKRL